MMKKLFIFLIRIYQYTMRPFVGSCCRFYPSCSEYAIEAYLRHGVFKGTYLTIRRILRCNPFNKGGVDFVDK